MKMKRGKIFDCLDRGSVDFLSPSTNFVKFSNVRFLHQMPPFRHKSKIEDKELYISAS